MPPSAIQKRTLAIMLIGPILSAVLLFAAATSVGVYPMRKLITIYEARHELKQGSAGWLRSIAGWSVIGFWLLITWFLATIIGDWAATGDLDGATQRAMIRLYVLMEFLAAMSSSN